MTSQLDFFGRAGGARKMAADLPEGFRYEPELIGPADEATLLAFLHELPFREFEFHGYTGKRRVVSFGWHYDLSAQHLRKADDIPDCRRLSFTLATSGSPLPSVPYRTELLVAPSLV